MDQSTICEGIGGITWSVDEAGAAGLVNVRSKYIQGVTASNNASTAITAGHGWDTVPNAQLGNGVTLPAGAGSTVRRYQIQLATGLFTQEKLIPTKFMASQLAVEITLEQAAGCIFKPTASLGSATATANFVPTYWVTDVNLIPEVLEFDGSYGTLN
jgi:hypothetical protein